VRESDLLVQVVDISHPQHRDHIKVVNKTLVELGAKDIPMLYVFNKMDLYKEQALDEFLHEDEKKDLLQELKGHWKSETNDNAVFISALKKEGMEELRAKLKELIDQLYTQRYPYKTRFW
jgi:GTP-binding protein HflX